MQPDQIMPAKAHHRSWLDQLWDHPAWVGEIKVDDIRALMHMHEDHNHFTTRVVSRVDGLFADKIMHVPHLSTHAYPELVDTILDGGLGYLDSLTTKASDLMSILGSSPDRGVWLQEINGNLLDYVVWDILFWKGKDVRGVPFETRRRILEKEIYPLLDTRYIRLMPQFSINKFEHYSRLLAAGGEGMVLKDLAAPYGQGWVKAKRVHTYDVFVLGYKEASEESRKVDGTVSPTKFFERGWIGAIEMGMYDAQGVETSVGYCSGIDEVTREQISERRDEYLGRVFEIAAQEQFPSGMFRHPRFIRWRDDKPQRECVIGL